MSAGGDRRLSTGGALVAMLALSALLWRAIIYVVGSFL